MLNQTYQKKPNIRH